MEYCLDCGKKLAGRVDKKFCDDHCRGHHNNRLSRGRNLILTDINSILKKNARILEKLNKNGITHLTYKSLALSGFNFNFFTHQVKETKGEVYNYCYNYGYHVIDKKYALMLISTLKK